MHIFTKMYSFTFTYMVPLVSKNCKRSAVELEKAFDYSADIPNNEYHPSMLHLKNATLQQTTEWL